MLDAVRIFFALGLPWLTGALFVMALWRSRQPGYPALVLGMGLPLGLAGVIGGYMVLGRWGSGLDFGASVAIQVSMAALFAVVAWCRPALEPANHRGIDDWRNLSVGWRWLIGILLAWLLLRWLGIVVEVVYRPLFPWDAWSGYSLETKVWFFFPEANTTTSDGRFFRGEDLWVAGTKHPPGIALIQLWSLQALGRWDDAIMNIAWPFGLLSLGLTLFGFLRINRVSLHIASLVVVLVLTLPVLNTHAVLAGYGDLWIGIFFLISVGSALVAMRESRSELILLSISSAIAMILIKGTAFIWAGVLLLALLGSIKAMSRLRLILIFVALVCAVAFWFYDGLVHIPKLGWIGFNDGALVWPRMIESGPFIDIQALLAAGDDMFRVNNWNVFWYLAIPVCAVGTWCFWKSFEVKMPLIVVILGLILAAVIFSMTTVNESVVDGTRVNRLLLHLVPLVGLLIGLVVEGVKSETFQSYTNKEVSDAE